MSSSIFFRPLRLLAISGSLRAGSSNAVLLEAAARLVPDDVTVVHYNGLGALPAFNPDDDAVHPPVEAVASWRDALRRADGVLLSSPEYAHGVPGALKNALDWVVGSGDLVDKPVGLLNPSPHSLFAHPQLAEILTTMNASGVPAAMVTVPIPRRGATAESIVADDECASLLLAAVSALLEACRARR
jgi:chromate reductase